MNMKGMSVDELTELVHGNSTVIKGENIFIAMAPAKFVKDKPCSHSFIIESNKIFS